MPEKTFQKLDQEKVYQILSKGIVFTMEDDLKEAMQSQKIKTNLIPDQVKPEQIKKENDTKPIFVEKAHFDPFQKLGSESPESTEQLLQKRKEIYDKIKNQKADLDNLFQKIEVIKEQKNQIEKQEQEAKDGIEKHNFEEQRWQIEEKLKQAQDLQWTQEEEIEKSQMVLSEIDNDYRVIQNKKSDFEKKQLENQKLLQDIKFSKQKEEILEKSQDIFKKRPEIEAKYNELSAVIQEEQKIEEQSKNIEKQIQGAMDAGERRKLEQERYEIAQKRQIQEKKRWEIEKLGEKLFKLKQEEQAINQKVAEIDAHLGEKNVVQQIRLQAKEREQEMVQKQFVQKQVAKEEQAMDEEQKQRQEQENRQKAIEKLRQIAEQEQKKLFTGKLNGPLLKEEILKKLTKVSPEEEAQRKDFLSRISQKTKPLPRQKLKGLEEGVVFHPMIKKISLFEKVAIRILIALLIIGIAAGAYFGITKLAKKETIKPLPINNIATTTINPTEEWPNIFPATTTEQTTTTFAVIMPPISLILVSKNNIFSYQENFQPIASSTKTIIENKKQYNSFEQISVFDENKQVFLSAMQFFGIMGAVLPEEISQENGTSTILIFSSKFGNRLGFVLQTENTANLKSSFLSWESQAEASTAPIFDLMDKEAPAMSKVFINVKYKTVSVRCQGFTKSDFGICYSAYKNYFIWTSSFEQMARLVDKLP